MEGKLAYWRARKRYYWDSEGNALAKSRNRAIPLSSVVRAGVSIEVSMLRMLLVQSCGPSQIGLHQ